METGSQLWEPPPEVQGRASNWNWPWIVFGLVGAIAANLIIRPRDPKLCKRLLIAGAIVSVIYALLSFLVLRLSDEVIYRLSVAPNSAAIVPQQAAAPNQPNPGSGNSATNGSSGTGSVDQNAVDKVAAAAGCPSDPNVALSKPSWPRPPTMTIDPSKTYTATITTDVGRFAVALDAKNAPTTVNNFVFLAGQKFYNCDTFHRVIPGFMDQTGDPTGTGSGGPGYQFGDELPALSSPQYPLGSVAMANSGPNTNGSQFFIVTGPDGESLAPTYSLFGQVTSGMGVVQQINTDGDSDASSNGVPPTVIHRVLTVVITSS